MGDLGKAPELVVGLDLVEEVDGEVSDMVAIRPTSTRQSDHVPGAVAEEVLDQVSADHPCRADDECHVASGYHRLLPS
ncbi:hypothetical protein NPS01_11490 [Nocardioides psychrotolerans]|nr:hypothetical protein NPS01_11490 [Nocardioides psychrotolerans]